MTKINDGTDLSVVDGVAVITLDFPPVNAMSPTLMDGLYDAMVAALGDDAVKAIVLLCAGRTFIAGADLKSLGKVEPKVDFFALQDSIENSSKPTVAALHGTPLGGGMETALTFHYRIAASGTQMGLPEVTLGLLPGGGGTQRLPRITGAEAALDMLIAGNRITAQKALEIGLIDRISGADSLRGEAIAFARELAAFGNPPRRIRDVEDRVAKDREDHRLFNRFRAAHQQKLAGLDAPQAIVRCVEAAVAGPWEAGLAVERAEYQKLLSGPHSAALRHVFMAERAAQKIAGIDRDTALRAIASVGIVGAGTMGSGIAIAFLDAGYRVTIVDRNEQALAEGQARIKGDFDRRVSSGKLTRDKADAATDRLEIATDLAPLAKADLVIEAVFEEFALKQKIFADIGAIAADHAILATNTSFLDVNALASASGRAGDVLGLHFFTPANVMPLLEIVRAE